MTLSRWLQRPVAHALRRQQQGRKLLSTSAVTNIQPEWIQEGIMDEQGLVVFDTLHNMQTRACTVYQDRNLFATYDETKQGFQWMSYKEYGSLVDKCRSVLHDLDVKPGDKVGIISNNRWEWATISAAAYSLNASIVPMYEAQLPADWTYILNDSNASVLFVANDSIMATVNREVLENAPNVKTVLSMDAPEGKHHAFSTAMEAQQPDTEGKYIQKPTPEDLANLIYTSGTTGKPKGVELTHDNFSSNVHGAVRTLVKNPHDFIRHDDVSLAFLPWAHSYGQTCELWALMGHGGSMGISRGIPTILDDLQHIQPTLLFSVPTLYKKVFDGVHNLMESASPIRRSLMKRALALGKENLHAKNNLRGPLGFFERIQFNALDKIVLDKIRARFGGRMRHGFVAGAACPKEVLDFMDVIGIPICEGYGLTETSPIISINTPESRSVGTVGRPIGGVKVYIVDEDGKEVGVGQDGEICCTGPNVMRGYHNNPAATEEVISTAPDGVSRMFHTGDMGRVTEDGFVKVTGRIKEQYKLENGKYVVPTPIEDAIGMSRFINQVVLSGANRPFNIALIVPEWPAIRTELKLKDDKSEEELASDERVKKLIDSEIAHTCARLKKFEIPQEWALVAPFTVANNMLTQKLSVRRHKVISAYSNIVAGLYGEEVEAEPEKDAAKEQAA